MIPHPFFLNFNEF